MMHRGNEPKNGDFLAYIERITGKPPATPEEIVREARKRTAEHAAGHGRPASRQDADAQRPAPAAQGTGAAGRDDARARQLPDIDLAMLNPIARGLTFVGIAIVAAALLLDEWLPLPSPLAGVVLIVLGAILRRASRGGLGTGRRFPARKT